MGRRCSRPRASCSSARSRRRSCSTPTARTRPPPPASRSYGAPARRRESGLRTAELLRREGAEVSVLTFPPDVFESGFRRASGVAVAQDAGFEVIEPDSSDELDAALAGHVAVFAGGPAGIQVLRRSGWQGVDGLKVVVDYSAADPVGVEGVERDDNLDEEDGVLKLGALGVGGP